MAAEAISRALRDGALEGEHAPALTIKDSIHAPLGAFVFDHILAQLSSNISSSKSQAQLRIVDCYTDPLGWKIQLAESGIVSNRSTQNATTASLCKNVRDLDMLFSSIVELGKEVIRETKGRFAVAIDSVSEILRHASISSAASLLSNLRSHDQVACLFWLFHSDLHEMKASSALEYISSMVACVEPISNTANGKGMNSENVPLIEQNLGRGKFSVRFKRRNGRIRLMSEELHTEQMGINFVPAFEGHVTSQSLVPKVQFNLQLSEKERNDRAKVVLPFEHQGDGKPIQIYDGRRSVSESKTENKETNAEKMHVNEDSGRGEIIYIRDSDDEMPDSDEDPDDDLISDSTIFFLTVGILELLTN
ncbi:elongator complex protein 5 isoform X2 [Coffea arabica]|uniref:Elongator complex protein 5 n=1 Tax=Coffea arabica TaxID=13443 RepID=A0ABM4V1T5_COFAR